MADVDDPDHCDSGLRMDIVRSLSLLVEAFPRECGAFVQPLLPTIWSALVSGVGQYVETVVNSDCDTGEGGAVDAVDSDGELLGRESLVYSLFALMQAFSKDRRYRPIVTSTLDDLVYHVISYMQITDEQIHVWSADANRYAEEEDDETNSYNVRVAGQELLRELAEVTPKKTAAAVCSAVTAHLRESQTIRMSVAAQQFEDADERADAEKLWWKRDEAALLALHSVDSAILSVNICILYSLLLHRFVLPLFLPITFYFFFTHL